MQKKRIKFILIALILLITTISAYSNEANKLTNQLKNITSNKKEVNSDLQQVKKQTENVTDQLKRLENQIEKTEKEISQLEKDISDTQGKIKIANKELISAEENIEGKKDLFGSRLNVMYRNGTIGYAEVLLTSKDFPELLTNLDMVKMIVQHDVDLLKYLQEQRELIEDKKVKLETDKKQLLSLRNNIENKRKDLQVSRGQQERLREDLLEDKEELENMLNQLERESKAIEAELIKLQSSGEFVGGEFQWPVTGHKRISSPYGNRIHPVLKTQRFHSGIDIPAPTGTPIVSANQGKVAYSGNMGGYGRTVIVDHGGGIMTLYAHNSKLLVSVGDSVTQGQKIALAGSTGLSTGPHLHFEVRKDGKYVDPIPYVKLK